MAITAAELLAIGNERTGRSEAQADVDKFIKSFVADLTSKGIVLEAEEAESLVDNQPNYDETTLLSNSFKKIAAITIDDSDGDEQDPLLEIPWKRYKERLASGATKGQPKEYARFNRTIYLWPAPNATNYPTMNVSGTIHHADSTTISYHERFREAATQFVIFKIYEKYGQAQMNPGKAAAALYEREYMKLKAEQDNSEVNGVGYNDI